MSESAYAMWLGLLGRTELIAGAIVTLVATLLGFAFAVAGDVWKESRKAAREHQRAARLLLDEMALNENLLGGSA